MAQAFLPAYLAVGEDHLKRDRILQRLKGHLDPSFMDFNLDELHASSDTSAEALTASLEQLPFGDSVRMVIVHDADKLPKETSEAAIAYLERPNPSTVLLMTADKLAKNTRLYKAVAALGAKSVMSCEAIKPWKLPEHAMKIAPGYGLRLLPDAAAELAARIGESAALVENALKTIAAVHGSGTVVDRALVEAEVARVVEPKPWDLCDALCERDARRSLSILRAFTKTSPVALHIFVTARLRELVCAKSLDAKGQGSRLASELGGQPWKFKNHLRWARRFSSGELAAALREAPLVEQALKGFGDGPSAFEAWVLQICVPGAPSVSEVVRRR